ncbi:Vacuolar ATPase assembly integral membrane protein VMA21-like [Quillaja saponaria]|uniref:Vacuolar ATPase assembly integral membrane protein VMA21-like n=1 Tax=Quillaja saponaria TaxID=32244 RepID=A0AAD7M3P8_QUISA|nr:Vacuolar ATPase assembly integral membrane protein VMA21-like [Quillaja saponaria]
MLCKATYFLEKIIILVSNHIYKAEGSNNLSPYSLTLVSGFLAVISVNIVIAFYIYLAKREPTDKHEPDPAFLAEAKASVNRSKSEAEYSSQLSDKKQE